MRSDEYEIANDFDLRAVEAAISLKESGAIDRVVVFSAAERTTHITKALAMGADEAIWACARDAELSPQIVVETAIEAVKQRYGNALDTAIWLMGKLGVNYESHLTAQRLALRLGVPCLCSASKLNYDAEGEKWIVETESEFGTPEFEASAPFVVTADLRSHDSRVCPISSRHAANPSTKWGWRVSKAIFRHRWGLCAKRMHRRSVANTSMPNRSCASFRGDDENASIHRANTSGDDAIEFRRPRAPIGGIRRRPNRHRLAANRIDNRRPRNVGAIDRRLSRRAHFFAPLGTTAHRRPSDSASRCRASRRRRHRGAAYAIASRLLIAFVGGARDSIYHQYQRHCPRCHRAPHLRFARRRTNPPAIVDVLCDVPIVDRSPPVALRRNRRACVCRAIDRSQCAAVVYAIRFGRFRPRYGTNRICRWARHWECRKFCTTYGLRKKIRRGHRRLALCRRFGMGT